MSRVSVLKAVAALWVGLIVAPSLQASVVNIDDRRCVTATAARVHEVTTGYDQYSSTPGARYNLNIPIFGAVPLLSMVKSQSKFAQRDGTGTDAFVWVVLQPSNLKDAAFYPRFLMECTSKIDSPEHFKHFCNLLKDRQHYGLQGFSSVLEVTEGASGCPAGETQMTYNLVLDGNDSEVTDIKGAVLAPAGPLAGPLGELFDVQSFFRNYYLNFYNGWIKTL